jgi:DNA helicase-2/ATP-dependent DNA helicase PcrA
MLEEERRLCYVGMTRARKRLYLTWARYRRRYGGGEQERSMPSRFLSEVPRELIEDLNAEMPVPQVDLTSERWEVRQTVKKNTFTGKTYNSLENIQQFFGERGVPFPTQAQALPTAANLALPPRAPAKPTIPVPAAPKKKFGPGATVEHPKYGTGTVLRREGEGEDAKITVSFARHGLKKLVEKYAGLKKS